MNALELLKHDHEKISGILEKLDQTTERAVKTREEQFARLRDELNTHSYIEESIFYPELTGDPRTRTIVLKALEEHRLVNTLLEELGVIAVDTEEWRARFNVLKDSVDQHVKEEEGAMFTQVRQVLSKVQLDALGEEMEARRRSGDKSTALTLSSQRTPARQTAAPSSRTRGGSRTLRPLAVSVDCPGVGFLRLLCHSPVR